MEIFVMVNKRCMFTGFIPETLREDFDKYLMGQIKHSDIMKKRNMMKHQVTKVLDYLTAERMMEHSKQKQLLNEPI